MEQLGGYVGYADAAPASWAEYIDQRIAEYTARMTPTERRNWQERARALGLGLPEIQHLDPP